MFLHLLCYPCFVPRVLVNPDDVANCSIVLIDRLSKSVHVETTGFFYLPYSLTNCVLDGVGS